MRLLLFFVLFLIAAFEAATSGVNNKDGYHQNEEDSKGLVQKDPLSRARMKKLILDAPRYKRQLGARRAAAGRRIFANRAAARRRVFGSRAAARRRVFSGRAAARRRFGANRRAFGVRRRAFGARRLAFRRRG